MIYDLKILNGELELPFNEYTYTYTVRVKEDINSLEFSYKLKEDTYVDIQNNILSNEESIVTLDVYNVNEEVVYTFYVYKDDSKEVSGLQNYMQSLEVQNKEEVSPLNIQFLALGIFFLIIICFSLIFKRKTKK